MYYEEKIVNEILCHRGTPDGEWIQFTLEQLTAKCVELEGKLLRY